MSCPFSSAPHCTSLQELERVVKLMDAEPDEHGSQALEDLKAGREITITALLY